ncbi:MAG: carbamoyltransferase HypF, partial [Candidatus Marinimicrobia bacterium]|nr:carbamoyltransferase HypF [Candidatus Neomarinimicrobiota bacterium]
VFSILPSQNNSAFSSFISPDIAVCPDCISECFDPKDRRYLYPFINCTNCGPRYTIIENIPYDRSHTSMRHFELCTDCQKEYDDPKDRRFHAQPNACLDCGPRCEILDSEGTSLSSSNSIKSTVEEIKKGKTVAIKGLGGFHLSVDATNEEAVNRLRERKGHESKPLAIMVKDLKYADTFFNLTEDEKKELESSAHPIVLVEKKTISPLAESVAPGLRRVGIMLPYTPIHHLLFYFDAPPLVMTSANITDEPICIDNSEA